MSKQREMPGEVGFGGECEPGFEDVFAAFKSNFSSGWEEQGASLTVYQRGRKVVDVWGGWADKSCGRRWREDTLSTIFSCTKSIGSICMAMLADRGHFDYADTIAKHWPEFGQKKKDSITIDQLMSHQSGLPYFSRPLSHDDIMSDQLMAEIIEKEKPLFSPGSRTGYHPLTWGWILDQLFRRIDPKKRTIGQFYNEELRDKFGLDLYMGDCAAEEHRVARLYESSLMLMIRQFVCEPSIIRMGAYYYNPFFYFPGAMQNMREWGTKFSLFNNPELRRRGQPAVNGVGCARSLAMLHQLVMEGKVLSGRMTEKISLPIYPDVFDYSVGEVQHKGHGFMYHRSPQGSWQWGHIGVGGQNVKVDPKAELVIAYVTNGMKPTAGEKVTPFKRLEKRAYRCAGKWK